MAEEQRWQEPGNHRPCANNCGFFGSPTTLHLCSKCYKDYCMKEQHMKDAHVALETTAICQSESSIPPPSSSLLPLLQTEFEPPGEQLLALAPQVATESSSAAEPKRCGVCHKRVLETTICQSESSILPPPASVPPSLQTESEPPAKQLWAPQVVTESSSTARPNKCGACQKRVLETTICQSESSIPPPSASVPLSLQTKTEPPAKQLAPQVATESSFAAKPNRCGACRKRVGLTGFACRCEVTFCGSHRYPEKHGCRFDYKAVGREAIAKANPVIKGEKLNKI